MNPKGTAETSSFIPSIDVIIPFHIIHNYLQQAIESALRSLGVNVRLLLVDDSDERYPEWLQEISKETNVRVIKNYNKGYLGALETGVLNTNSDYVGFLDSDDLTEPYRFYRQICYMRENNLEISSSSIFRVDQNGKTLKDRGLLGSQFETIPPRVRLLLGAYGADSSLVLNGNVIRENWDIHKSLPPQFADYGFLLKTIKTHTYGYCPEGVYFYRTHEFQMSRERALLDSWGAAYPFWKDLLCDLEALLPSTAQLPLNSKTAAAIAFPSLFPKLERNEIKLLERAIKSLVLDLKPICDLSSRDIVALKMRLLIGSRWRRISTWRYLPILVWRVVGNGALGLWPRKN